MSKKVVQGDLRQRAARLIREDAAKFVSSKMWDAKRECENEGGIKIEVALNHARTAIAHLTEALAEYERAAKFARELEKSDAH